MVGLGTGRVRAGDGGTAEAEDAGARAGVGEGARAGTGDGGRVDCAPPPQPASTATAMAHTAARQREPTVTIPRYPADMRRRRAERSRSPTKGPQTALFPGDDDHAAARAGDHPPLVSGCLLRGCARHAPLVGHHCRPWLSLTVAGFRLLAGAVVGDGLSEPLLVQRGDQPGLGIGVW